MNFPRQPISSILFSLALAVSISACSVGLPNVAGPSAPCRVNVSKQAADRFLQRIQQQANARGKTVTITATSDEVSSVLAQAIDQATQSSGSDIVPLQNPVVCFSDGKMSLFGQMGAEGSNSINALLSIRAGVSNGKAAFKVEQVQVGPFSVPQGFGDQVSQLLNGALNQNLKQINLTEIKIQNNQMTLTGRVP